MKIIVIVAVACALFVAGSFLLKGAGRAMTERIMEKMTGAKVEINDDETTYKTDEGTMTTGKKIPNDWPTDAPLYPKATVQFAGTANSIMGDAGTAVVLLSTADLQEVKNYYRTELVDQGWDVKNTMEAQASTIYLAEKDGRTLSVTVTGNDGAVGISIGLKN